MKKCFNCMMSAALLTGMALAQAGAPPSNDPVSQSPSVAGSAQPNKVAAGTVIPAELEKTIDAKKVKPGDPVLAKTTQDLVSNGQVVIPRGAKITGHVTAAKAHEKSDPASSVGIAFDQLATKNGQALAFQADIQAMGRSPQNAASAATAGEPMAPGSGMSSPGTSNQSMGGMGRQGASQPGGNTSPVGTVPQADAQQAPGVPLSASSQGVVGLEDVSLSAQADPAQGSMITSAKKNVHLDSGTQLILRAK